MTSHDTFSFVQPVIIRLWVSIQFYTFVKIIEKKKWNLDKRLFYLLNNIKLYFEYIAYMNILFTSIFYM